MRTSLIAFTGLMLVLADSLAAVTLGQQDTFSDGTTQGWLQGASSPNPTTNIATGGPAGAGDRYLQNVSSGGSGAGSKMIMFNQAQWTGNYTAAGVTRIDANMANFGSTVLHMRIALKNGSDEYASTNAVVLPADGKWYQVGFEINAGSMTQVAGTNPLAVVLGAVQEARILSSSVPAYNGDAIVGTLGADNITATISGDVNGDGVVNLADLLILAAAFGSVSGGANWNPAGDLNNDGRVDVSDLLIMAANWGT
jgi:hypothetical protein